MAENKTENFIDLQISSDGEKAVLMTMIAGEQKARIDFDDAQLGDLITALTEAREAMRGLRKKN